jgi:non-heme chloroperoxidase
MPFIETADRTSLFVTDWGSGPPVVFTHAWGLRSDQWNYQIPALAEAGLRCVLYDRRGHGRSDRPATGYDIDTLADDLAGVISHFDLHGATLIAHSLGSKEAVATSPATATPASPGWSSSDRPRRCCAAQQTTLMAWTPR